MHEYDLSTAQWRKSSYSNGDGGSCVEVAYDFAGSAQWRKSTYSDGTGGDCVEVLDNIPGVVPVRDSKNPHGPALIVTATAWAAFVAGIKR
ncbi:DUF397 domain-containing protein [Streptomyces sp. A3M-1-3]|uniref:DUF397 domain-containing protein n=1 Tax=Streptomyces sp. A3M-1-3 TaxID=2962044 RepID=UPI0020B7EBF8|nr:DUF397 domain-containing protein [Streptomyces sp. A3M-1-3]MCP3817635.1 DUF397 domain-containing protein [Streptomyces sp. A3M-1-3]